MSCKSLDLYFFPLAHRLQLKPRNIGEDRHTDTHASLLEAFAN